MLLAGRGTELKAKLTQKGGKYLPTASVMKLMPAGTGSLNEVPTLYVVASRGPLVHVVGHNIRDQGSRQDATQLSSLNHEYPVLDVGAALQMAVLRAITTAARIVRRRGALAMQTHPTLENSWYQSYQSCSHHTTHV